MGFGPPTAIRGMLVGNPLTGNPLAGSRSQFTDREELPGTVEWLRGYIGQQIGVGLGPRLYRRHKHPTGE